MKRLLLATSLLLPTAVYSKVCGHASWYQYGKVTASGKSFYPDALTAASKTLPFGTKLKVSYKNKQVVVTVNDRGPFVKGRILDLSRGAARKLGMLSTGVARVCYERL